MAYGDAPPSPRRNPSSSPEELRRALLNRQIAEEESRYIRQRGPTDPVEFREMVLARVRAAHKAQAEAARLEPEIHEPPKPLPKSPPIRRTIREAENLTTLRLRVSARRHAWAAAVREARGRPEEVEGRTGEKLREAARCDARAAAIAASENVGEAVRAAVCGWHARAQSEDVKRWYWGVSFEECRRVFRERAESQATPGTEEEWKVFTDRLPGEIKLRRYKAGRRAPRIVELTELTDALGQALAYCLHLDENFELDKAIDAATSILLVMIFKNRVFAPAIYEWLVKKKQGEDEQVMEVPRHWNG